METSRAGASHVTPSRLNDIQTVAPLQVTRSPRLNSTGQAMSDRLEAHFKPYKDTLGNLSTEALSESGINIADFDRIRDDRAERLQTANCTVHDMEKAEGNAAKADRLFASIKTAKGGTPFAALTEAGNFAPSILQVGGVNPNPLREAGKENAVSSLYACVADVITNKVAAGFTPGYYLKPERTTLDPALQKAIAQKISAADKGPLRNAVNAATEQLVGFGIRNTLVYGMSLGLTALQQQELDAILRPALKPVSAILVGMAIEHYHVSQDRKQHIAGPAMIYGRRDAVPVGEAFKPPHEDNEWLDDFMTLKDLNANALTKMVSARLGEGAAVGLKALLSGDAFKEVFDPTSTAGGGLLTLGFALTGISVAAISQKAKDLNLGPTAAAALTNLVGDVMNTVAFGLWGFGASLGASLPSKAGAAVDAHVPEAVEGAANTLGRGAVRGGTAFKDGAGYVKGQAISSGHQVAAGFSSAIEVTSAAMSNRINAMRVQPAATAPGQTQAGQSIAMQSLAPAQASSSALAPAPPSARDAGDVV